jgi:hypothetical protein
MQSKTKISSRDRAIAAISGLHQNATYDEMMYKLYVLEKIEKGEDDFREGKVYSTAEAKKRLAKWLK